MGRWLIDMCFSCQLLPDGDATGIAELAQLPRLCVHLFDTGDIVPRISAQALSTRRASLCSPGGRGRQHSLLLCGLHRECRFPRWPGLLPWHGLHCGTSRLSRRGRCILRLDRIDDPHGQGHVHEWRASGASAGRQGNADSGSVRAGLYGQACTGAGALLRDEVSVGNGTNGD